VPGQLHAAILRSTQVHARIRGIDTAAARALPGVHAVITAADVPWQRPIGVSKDHLPLKSDRVRSLRDEVAAVAADTEAIAREALGLIKVDYEPLPLVTERRRGAAGWSTAAARRGSALAGSRCAVARSCARRAPITSR
jgi:CO/xanthine dehydrogenase Mo-binding subunit